MFAVLFGFENEKSQSVNEQTGFSYFDFTLLHQNL